ncbi:unnamed protein product [Pedinophyceae sp. YPF-701]|nr:unnamed protein product [Pedinophyceae sp. YPF-701]
MMFAVRAGARAPCAQAAPARPAARRAAHRMVARAASEMDVETKVEAEAEGLTGEEINAMMDLMCNETEFLELGLEMKGFKMTIKRSSGAVPETPVAAAAPAPAEAPAPSPAPAEASTSSLSDDEEDASVVSVEAPKVGIFRRGYYARGKRVGNGNSVDVGQEVKQGTIVGFVEQLGTFWPVEAPMTGEVFKFLKDDGDTVGYKDVVAEMHPFFGGNLPGERV